MRPSRVVGWAVGVGILAAAFLLPFWNLTTGQAQQLDSLYQSSRFTLDSIGQLMLSGQAQVYGLAFSILFASLAVGASGVLGVLPRASGLLGVVGMLGMTVGPILFFPGYSLSLGNLGTGFWVIWALSVANLLVGVAAGGRKAAEPASAAPTVSPPPPAPVA